MHLAGDMNTVLSPNIDRFHSTSKCSTPLEACMTQYNLVEAWRWKHPDAHAYSCFSFTYSTLPRDVLPRVVEVQYLARTISAHSPMLLTLALGQSCGYKLWGLSPLWLKKEYFERLSVTSIGNFWSENKDEALLSVTWDTFKATLRGSISGVIKKLRSDRECKIRDCEQAATEAEVEHIRNPSSNFTIWRDFAHQLDFVLVEKTQKKLLYQSQRVFDFGDKYSN